MALKNTMMTDTGGSTTPKNGTSVFRTTYYTPSGVSNTNPVVVNTPNTVAKAAAAANNPATALNAAIKVANTGAKAGNVSPTPSSVVVNGANAGVVAGATSASPSTSTSNGGGGNGGGSYSGGGSVSYTAPSQGNDYLQQAMDAYRQAMEAQRAQAEQAYQTALANLQNARNQSANNLRQNSDEAKRQAFINYMLGKRDVNQQLSNQGINGGATESVLADMFNTYGNNRNAIDNNYANALAELDTRYNENVANLGANYGQDTTGITSNYYNTIANLQANYASDLAKALGKTSSSYGSGLSNSSNYKNAVNAIKAVGNDANAMRRAMALYGYDMDSEDGQKLMLDAGINPFTSTPNVGGGSPIANPNVAGAGNMQRALQTAYNQNGQDGAIQLANSLISQGYSKDYVQSLLDSVGL